MLIEARLRGLLWDRCSAFRYLIPRRVESKKLLDKITTFDARIQQKLKDFGLLIPPSRTEDSHRIPIELELLWTPVKKVNAIDVTARVVEPGKEQEQSEGVKK